MKGIVTITPSVQKTADGTLPPGAMGLFSPVCEEATLGMDKRHAQRFSTR